MNYIKHKKVFFLTRNSKIDEIISEEKAKELLRRVDVDKYIELFGEVEEG